MKIAVLGGCGRQGKIIAKDLTKDYQVHTMDISDDADVKLDLSDYNNVRSAVAGYDLVVGALPSALGMDAMNAVVDSGANYVDLSFLDYDVSNFNDKVLEKNSTLFYDCGVAPGLSHLVAGRAIALGANDIRIYVGGVSANREDDYVITWSPEDLLEDYIRPVKIVWNGEIITVPPLSDQEEKDMLGVGKLKAFYTDGLRSLLAKRNKVNRIEEKTMRWPGHIQKIGPLLSNHDTFVDKVKELYREGTDDVVCLQVEARWADGQECSHAFLRVYGDDEMSAMTRTTALSCSAFAQLLASEKYTGKGVVPPEDVALDEDAYKFVLNKMAEHGVEFSPKYPFCK